MSWPDYIRLIPTDTYNEMAYAGAAGAAALAMIIGPRGNKRNRDGSLTGNVGGPGDGPGRVTVSNGFINNFPSDASIVKCGLKGAGWVNTYNDPRRRQDQLIWPRHLVQKLQDKDPIIVLGTDAKSTVVHEPLYNAEHLKVIAMTGTALHTGNGGGTGQGLGGMQQDATGVAVSKDNLLSADLNAFATMEIPLYNTRFRLRNTSNRDAQLRLFEFTCRRSCNGSVTPIDMWQDALNQQKITSTVSDDVVIAVNAADPGTWDRANTNIHLTTTPYKRPFGYGEFWTLTNEVKIQLHPGKQMLYCTKCARKSIPLKLLNQLIETNGDTGNIAGFTKYLVIIAIGDRITNNGAAVAGDAGDYGFSDCRIAMDKEEQFVTSTVWAVRPKTIYLHNTADGKLTNEYYHHVATANQGGTASGVQAVRPTYTASVN